MVLIALFTSSLIANTIQSSRCERCRKVLNNDEIPYEVVDAGMNPQAIEACNLLFKLAATKRNERSKQKQTNKNCILEYPLFFYENGSDGDVLYVGDYYDFEILHHYNFLPGAKRKLGSSIAISGIESINFLKPINPEEFVYDDEVIMDSNDPIVSPQQRQRRIIKNTRKNLKQAHNNSGIIQPTNSFEVNTMSPTKSRIKSKIPDVVVGQLGCSVAFKTRKAAKRPPSPTDSIVLATPIRRGSPVKTPRSTSRKQILHLPPAPSLDDNDNNKNSFVTPKKSNCKSIRSTRNRSLESSFPSINTNNEDKDQSNLFNPKSPNSASKISKSTSRLQASFSSTALQDSKKEKTKNKSGISKSSEIKNSLTKKIISNTVEDNDLIIDDKKSAADSSKKKKKKEKEKKLQSVTLNTSNSTFPSTDYDDHCQPKPTSPLRKGVDRGVSLLVSENDDDCPIVSPLRPGMVRGISFDDLNIDSKNDNGKEKKQKKKKKRKENNSQNAGICPVEEDEDKLNTSRSKLICGGKSHVAVEQTRKDNSNNIINTNNQEESLAKKNSTHSTGSLDSEEAFWSSTAYMPTKLVRGYSYEKLDVEPINQKLLTKSDFVANTSMNTGLTDHHKWPTESNRINCTHANPVEKIESRLRNQPLFVTSKNVSLKNEKEMEKQETKVISGPIDKVLKPVHEQKKKVSRSDDSSFSSSSSCSANSTRGKPHLNMQQVENFLQFISQKNNLQFSYEQSLHCDSNNKMVELDSSVSSRSSSTSTNSTNSAAIAKESNKKIGKQLKFSQEISTQNIDTTSNTGKLETIPGIGNMDGIKTVSTKAKSEICKKKQTELSTTAKMSSSQNKKTKKDNSMTKPGEEHRQISEKNVVTRRDSRVHDKEDDGQQKQPPGKTVTSTTKKTKKLDREDLSGLIVDTTSSQRGSDDSFDPQKLNFLSSSSSSSLSFQARDMEDGSTIISEVSAYDFLRLVKQKQQQSIY